MGLYIGRGCGDCGVGGRANSPGVNSLVDADRLGGRTGVYCGGMPGGGMKGGAVADSLLCSGSGNSGE